MSELIEIFNTGIYTSEGKEKTIYVQVNSDATKLYINGNEILTKEVISLRKFELILLVMTAMGAFSSGAMAIISYFHLFAKCIT